VTLHHDVAWSSSSNSPWSSCPTNAAAAAVAAMTTATTVTAVVPCLTGSRPSQLLGTRLPWKLSSDNGFPPSLGCRPSWPRLLVWCWSLTQLLFLLSSSPPPLVVVVVRHVVRFLPRYRVVSIFFHRLPSRVRSPGHPFFVSVRIACKLPAAHDGRFGSRVGRCQLPDGHGEEQVHPGGQSQQENRLAGPEVILCSTCALFMCLSLLNVDY